MVASTWLQDVGRQEEIVAFVDIDHSDMAATDGGTIATGTYEAVQLPEGAVVTGGFAMILEAFPASVTLEVGDDGDIDRYLDAAGGAPGTAVYPQAGSIGEQTLNDLQYLAPTGYKYTAANSIDVVVGGAAPTASGKLRLCVKYIVAGRAAFSEG